MHAIICIFDFTNFMNLNFYNKVHKVQANDKVQKVQTELHNYVRTL